MNESWIRQAALDRAAGLRREAAQERLARLARSAREAERAAAERPTPLLSFRLPGRLWLHVELWPR